MKKFLLIFLFSFACFFGIDRLYAIDSASADGSVGYADVYPLKYRINSADATAYNFNFNYAVNIEGQKPFYIDIPSWYYYNQSGNYNYVPSYLYGRVNLCISNGGEVSSGWGSNNIGEYHSELIQDVFFYGYNDIGCTVYGGTPGYLVQVTYTVKGRVVSVDYEDISVRLGTNVTNAKISLLGYDFSTKPFDRYNPLDTTNRLLLNILNKNNYSDELISIKQEQTETNKKLQEQNQLAKDKIAQDKKHHDEIMNDDTSGANSEAESFFSGFSTDTHGLTGIITAPITLIGNITSSSCTPLQVPLPYVNKNISLPCMSSIYSKYFGSFYDIYKIITFGIVSYWVCVRIFNLVKDFKNPEHDEIEVMDL